MRVSRKPLVLFDTNVLVYASDASAPQHVASKKLRDQVESRRLAAAITVQVLLEYFAVITGKRVTRPRSSAEAARELAALVKIFTVVHPPRTLIRDLQLATEALNISGPNVYDLAIALTARSAGIKTIMSYDDSVFERVPGIEVETP